MTVVTDNENKNLKKTGIAKPLIKPGINATMGR